MATVQPGFPFLGTIFNISVYKRWDLDKPIARRKGGPTKKQILETPEFENTRKNIGEFSGRSAAAMWLRSALEPLRPLADYNIAGYLNALIKPVQEMDPVGEWGKRNIELTRNPRILEGFSLNKKEHNLFGSVIRNTIGFTLNKETLEATVDIPALIPGINFHAAKHPMFSLVITPVIVPNLYYDKQGYKPASDKYRRAFSDTRITEWFPVLNGSPAMSVQMKIDFTPPDENYIMLLAVGIRYGTIGAGGDIMQVKRVGSAKIIAAV